MEEKLGSRLWAILMTGTPYAIFKFGAGWYLYADVQPLLGGVVMAWGGFDLLSNVLALISPDATAYCSLADIGRMLDRGRREPWWENLMLAVDTLVTLLIVSGMIWFGHLPLLPPTLGLAWNVAVVANVTGVGVQRVWQSVHTQTV
jgi:hypothetical protein